MTVHPRVAFRLLIPILYERQGEKRFSAIVGLRVGPFDSEHDARQWEQDFVRGATIEWEKEKHTESEGRTLRGVSVRSVFGEAQVDIGRVTGDLDLFRPRVRFEIEQGELTTHDRRNLEGRLDVDATQKGSEVGKDLDFYVRSYLKAALDE